MDRFRDAYPPAREIPGILEGRQQRRHLRRGGLILLVALAVVVGVIGGFKSGFGGIAMSIGRSLLGVTALSLVGLMVGVALTALAAFMYNGVLNGKPSLIDLDYIDEVPLLFAGIGGIGGIFWSLQWSDVFGLFGWGLLALVLNESIFTRPNDRDRG